MGNVFICIDEFSEWRSYFPVIAYFVLGLVVIWKDPLKVVWLFT